MRDPATESRLLEGAVNMELEHNDVLRASKVTFKFVGFQAPSSMPPKREHLPSSL